VRKFIKILLFVTFPLWSMMAGAIGICMFLKEELIDLYNEISRFVDNWWKHDQD
jgi:hypothetical protein